MGVQLLVGEIRRLRQVGRVCRRPKCLQSPGEGTRSAVLCRGESWPRAYVLWETEEKDHGLNPQLMLGLACEYTDGKATASTCIASNTLIRQRGERVNTRTALAGSACFLLYVETRRRCIVAQ